MLKKIISGCLIIFVVLLAVVTLSEAMLRLSGRVAVKGLHTASDQVFENIPGIFEPGQDFIYRANPKLPFHISINSLGFRGPEINREKPPGTIRVLCLGDSLTFGDFVNDDETFPYRLQEISRQEKKLIEFVNGGVGGSTIIDQFFFLKKGMEIDPDIVILTFFLNDIPELAQAEPLYKSFEKNRKFKSSFFSGSIYKLFRDTALFQLALKAKAKYSVRFQKDREPEGDSGLNTDILNKETELLEIYSKFLKEMNDYLKEHSIGLMFIIFPSHHQIGQRTGVSDLQDYRIDWIERLAQEMGIPTLNLLKLFKESNLGKNELYLLPHDGHPSKTAYSLAAYSVYGNLQQNFSHMFKNNPD